MPPPMIGGGIASLGTAAVQGGTPLPTPPVVTDTGTATKPTGPRGGPGGPGGPGAVDGTQDGAARKLNEAYNEIARYQQLVSSGAVPDVAKTLASSAANSYTQAISAYNAKTYAKAAYLAEASKKATSAAKHAIQAERGTTALTATGVPTPPALATTDSSQEKAARELNHAYEKIGQAQAVVSTDQTVVALRTSAESLYKAASSDYAAKKYESANERAHAAKDAADAAAQLAQALASQS